MGFATGSPRGVGYKRPTYVLHTIEYLTFDPKKREIHVFGDFLARNVSKSPGQLRVVHRGNIDFEAVTTDWPEDRYWTRPLLEMWGEETGLGMENEDIVFNSAQGDQLKVELLSGRQGQLKGWVPLRPEDVKGQLKGKVPLRPEDGSYIPFTGFDTPRIEPGKLCLFRVAGTIGGESYKRFMPNPESEDPIIIAGGMPLQEQIRLDAHYLHSPKPKRFFEEKKYFPLSEESLRYRDLFQGFVDQYYAWPNSHYFFIEFADGRSVDISSRTPDIKEVGQNVTFGDRKITCVRSDYDFNKIGDEHGPKLEIRGVDQTAKRKK